MHGRRARGETKKPLDARYERLFEIVAELRAPAIQHLHALFFAPTFGIHLSSTYRRIETLRRNGYLATGTFPGTPHAFVHLTEKGRTAFPALARDVTENVRKPPAQDIAAWGWQRAALWAALVADGFRVGHDLDALIALRRHLVDEQERRTKELPVAERHQALRTLESMRASPLLTPLYYFRCASCGARTALGERPPAACPRCVVPMRQVVVDAPYACARCGTVAEAGGEHAASRDGPACPGTLRRRPYLPFDVAHRRVGGVRDVIVLVVDHPFRGITRQLEELPLRFLGQPQVKVILRASDDESVWDIARKRWAFVGSRLRRLRNAFAPRRGAAPFPFWRSAQVVDYRPELVLRTVGSGH